jgi:hypothetical protein
LTAFVEAKNAPLILFLRFKSVVGYNLIFAEDDKRKDEFRAALNDAEVDAVLRRDQRFSVGRTSPLSSCATRRAELGRVPSPSASASIATDG